MSVYIPGMEMPTSCAFCRFYSAYCYAKGDEDAHSTAPCPLVPIPPHGRLTDFDRIEAIMKNACDECKESSMEFDGFYADCGQCLLDGVKKALMFAPTIIPAEEANE